MSNIFNKLQFNEITSISSIVIIYEITILLLCLIKVLNYNLCKNLISPLIYFVIPILGFLLMSSSMLAIIVNGTFNFSCIN